MKVYINFLEDGEYEFFDQTHYEKDIPATAIEITREDYEDYNNAYTGIKKFNREGKLVFIQRTVTVYASELKAIRDHRLQETDWTQLPDTRTLFTEAELNNLILQRQRLRDFNYREFTALAKQLYLSVPANQDFFTPTELSTEEVEALSDKDKVTYSKYRVAVADMPAIEYIFVNDLEE